MIIETHTSAYSIYCTAEHKPAHIDNYVSLSTAVRGCEHEIRNEKNIDLRIYSEILASPSLPIDIIIADGPHGQMLLTLIYLLNHYSLLTGWIESEQERNITESCLARL